MPQSPQQHLPLKPVELELLLALAESERHGYGLVQAIAERTEGVVALEPGERKSAPLRQIYCLEELVTL